MDFNKTRDIPETKNVSEADIHLECRHFGGIHECRKVENSNGGGFDE